MKPGAARRLTGQRGRLGLIAALTGDVGDAGGVVQVLRPTVAASPGTDRLEDAAVGTPIDPDTGLVYTQFAVDAYVDETDAVGVPVLYDSIGGAHSAVAAGLPDDQRDSAVSSIGAAAYFGLNTATVLAANPAEWSFAVWNTRVLSTTSDVVADLNNQSGLGPGVRVFMAQASSFNAFRLRCRTSGGVNVVDATTSSGVVGTAQLLAIYRLSRSAGTWSVRIYDSTGALLNSTGASAVLTDVPWTGGVTLGSNAGGATQLDAARNTGVQWGLWNSLLSDAACDAIAAAGAAGAWPIAASHAWRGMRSGAVDESAPTVLLRAPTGGVTAELYP
jgi:hypothetical protein